MDNLGQAGEGPQPTLAVMRSVQRWLIWQSVPEPGKKPRKVPHYLSGARRHGTLDTPEDWARLATYDQAKGALAGRGADWGLAFALGPDSSGWCWQGVDFDDVQANQLGGLANAVPGYVEFSPSQKGAHAVGYGRPFATLGSNGSGIEAYASGRFFTVTEHVIRDGVLVDLAEHVEQQLAPRHGAARAPQANASVETELVDAKTITELRSALAHMPSDDRDLWVRMGMALRVLGQLGEGLWTEWSQKSEKYDAKDAARVWRSLKPSDTGYQAVFAEAQRQGWVNPSSNAAQLAAPAPTKPPAELLDVMDVDWTDDEDAEVPNIVEGLVVDEDVTLLGGHGGIGKSFLALQMACAVALGQPVLGQATRQMRVLYYSAEDGRKRLKRRLRKIVAKFNYDPVDLRGKLRVLDASEMDPLFSEVPRNIGTKEKPYVMKYLGETENFTNLQALVADFDPQLVIVDGGSDTFDGNEIARREVRAFVKALRRVHPARPIGVLLAVHIDRASARGNVSADDGYAGSAQWHNSCRHRLWLQAETEKDEDTRGVVQTGTFKLRVMKDQDGDRIDDMEVTNADEGVWALGVTIGGALVGEAPVDHRVVIAQLIQEHYDRGEWITTSFSANAPTGAHASLKGDPRWPRKLKKAAQTNEVLRDMLRDGTLGKEPFQKADRHWAERWVVMRDPSQPFVPPAGSAGSGGE